VSGDDRSAPLFTGDDYQLIAEASYREEERLELWRKLHGFDAPVDDQLDRLTDLCRRISEYLQLTGQV
jgi:hypothetical protein